MAITIKQSGSFETQIEELRRRALELDGQHEIPLTELMSPEFMSDCSSFASFNELIEKSPFTVNSVEDFKAIPDADWDEYIAANTSFESWKEMQQEAAKNWTRIKLGFK